MATHAPPHQALEPILSDGEMSGDMHVVLDRLAKAHPGKLKWGIEWLPAEDVKRYRVLRGSPQETAAVQLLRQLESDGLIKGSWEHPDRRTRRYYSITAAGRTLEAPGDYGAEGFVGSGVGCRW